LSFDIASKKETELKRLSAGYIHALAVSPNGAKVAFVTVDGTERAGSVQVMPAAGGESRELLRDPDWDGSGNLAWTPDGRYLLFAKPENAKTKTPSLLWRVPVTGGAPEKLGISMGSVASPVIHPDGKRVAFEVHEPGPSELWALENFLPKAAGK
jgi:Tol biopolymer transport system component